MRIGSYTIEPALILAPMAGVTDKPFRQLCKRLGAGYAVSEMTTADPRLWRTKKSLHRMDHEGEPAPIGVQIAGADPDALAAAARHNVEHGAQIIDINMGCPAKKVCNAWSGSALLQDETLVARILRAVVAAVDVPVTLKIRTGWDRDHKNGVAVARIAEDAGIQALAVHGRTRDMLYTGEAEYETIAAIKQAVTIPVIANGDVDSAAKGAPSARAHRRGRVDDRSGRAGQAVDLPRDRALPRDRRGAARAHAARDPRRAAGPRRRAARVLRGTCRRADCTQASLGWYAKNRAENAAFRDVVNRAEIRARAAAARARLFRCARGAIPRGSLSAAA